MSLNRNGQQEARPGVESSTEEAQTKLHVTRDVIRHCLMPACLPFRALACVCKGEREEFILHFTDFILICLNAFRVPGMSVADSLCSRP